MRWEGVEPLPPGFLPEPEGVGVAMFLGSSHTGCDLRTRLNVRSSELELRQLEARANRVRRHVTGENKGYSVGAERFSVIRCCNFCATIGRLCLIRAQTYPALGGEFNRRQLWRMNRVIYPCTRQLAKDFDVVCHAIDCATTEKSLTENGRPKSSSTSFRSSIP